jgi:hypothetical protein
MRTRRVVFLVAAFLVGTGAVLWGNPPNPPVAFTLTQPTANTVSLTWQSGIGANAGYHIYRDHELVATIPTTGPLTWSGSLPGYGIYAFSVRAFNVDGDSDVRIHRTATWLAPSGQASSLRQWGITWTFAAERQFGQFANGDLWIVGPLSITAIDPPCQDVIETVDGQPVQRTINGAMLDPFIPTVPSTVKQGYDSLESVTYSEALNVARGVSAATPLAIAGGHSLVSVISYAPVGDNPVYVRVAAVLTVLTSAPPAGSFRPSYSSPSKAILHNASELDYSILRTLPIPSVAPPLPDITSRMERAFLDHFGSHFGPEGSISPHENMDDYGRDVSVDIGDAVLSLNLNYANSDKAKLFIAMVQMGLDLYGVTQVGGGSNAWHGWGGHFLGRKLPIIFAGMALHDAALTGTTAAFAEDDLTYYFDDPHLPASVRGQYSWTGSRVLYKFNYYWDDPHYGQLYEHKHPATWTKEGDTVPYITDALAENYRTCCTARAWLGIALSVRLMEATAQWRNQSFLDYMDRWMYENMTAFIPILNLAKPESVASNYQRSQSRFATTMWAAHRNLVDLEPPTAPIGLVVTGSGTNPRVLSWDRCGDNVGGVGYRVFRNGELLATVYENSFTDSAPPAGALDYTIQAFDWAGNENPGLPVITRLVASPATIDPGQSTTLTWNVTGAPALSIDNGVGAVTGSSVVVTPASTTTYTLTASNGIGSTTARTVVTVVGSPPATAKRFFPLAPCRALDTRLTNRAGAAAPMLAAWQRRELIVGGTCGVPAGAAAISTNVTVVNAQAAGDLRITGGHLTSTLTSALAIPLERARANNAIIELDPTGTGTIAVTNDSAGFVHFILDVNGYFQ